MLVVPLLLCDLGSYTLVEISIHMFGLEVFDLLHEVHHSSLDTFIQFTIRIVQTWVLPVLTG